MTWTVKIDDRARRHLRKLDHQDQRRILTFLRERIEGDADPRRIGRALTGQRTGLWRYRVGRYRLVCRIADEVITVIVVRVGHRREVYRR